MIGPLLFCCEMFLNILGKITQFLSVQNKSEWLFSLFSAELSDDPNQKTKQGLEVNKNDPLNKLGKKKPPYINWFLHNTCHFNLTVHFQNWSLQLILKITWSLAKIKVVIVKKFKMFLNNNLSHFRNRET